MENKIPRRFRRVASAAVIILASAAASAETFTVILKTSGGSPMAGETITFYKTGPTTLLATATTDASGSVTFTDNVFVGQFRCVEVQPKLHWTFTWLFGDAPMVKCANNFDPIVNYWGQRTLGTDTRVFVVGGARGYINPDRNETVQIYFNPYQNDTVTAKIYSQRGKLVAVRTKAVSGTNQNEIAWNGRNADGAIVASGIYIVHLSGAGINTTRKVAVVRN